MGVPRREPSRSSGSRTTRSCLPQPFGPGKRVRLRPTRVLPCSSIGRRSGGKFISRVEPQWRSVRWRWNCSTSATLRTGCRPWFHAKASRSTIWTRCGHDTRISWRRSRLHPSAPRTGGQFASCPTLWSYGEKLPTGSTTASSMSGLTMAGGSRVSLRDRAPLIGPWSGSVRDQRCSRVALTDRGRRPAARRVTGQMCDRLHSPYRGITLRWIQVQPSGGPATLPRQEPTPHLFAGKVRPSRGVHVQR